MDYTVSMRGKMIVFAFVQLLLLQVLPMATGEVCPYGYDLLAQNPNTRYCSGGCCGTKYSDYSDVCCEDLELQTISPDIFNAKDFNTMNESIINVGLIVGSVVGGLVGLAILISIIICCCVASSRSHRSPGAVIQPMNTNPQTLVLNSTTVAQGPSTNPVHYPYSVAQPGYVQYENLPQGRADPDYPPPPYAAKY